MKSSCAWSIAASVVAAVASSAMAESSLVWIGQIHIDGPVVVLTGTAEEIYRNITAANASYDNDLGLNSSNPATTISSLNVALAKRAPTSDDYTCAYGNYVNALDAAKGIRSLYNIGNGDCAAPPGRPGAGGCTTSACNGQSGVFLCNDHDFTLHIPCRLIADNAVEIMIKCQNNDVVRGQIFSDDRGWNTIINRC